MSFQLPAHVVAKGADVRKLTTDLRLRYAKALMTMETTRTRSQQIDNLIKDRNEKGNPLSPEEAKNYQLMREQHQKSYEDARKFVEQLRKQQETLNKANLEKKAQGAPAAGQAQPQVQATSQAQTQPQVQTPIQPPTQTPIPPPTQNLAPNPPLQNTSAVTATVNAAVEAAKNQTQVATPTQQQVRPAPAAKPIPVAQQQASAIKTEQVQPPPVNTQVAAATTQHPSASTPTQASARVQTPQSGTPVAAGARPLSMSAAVNLANQRIAQPGAAAAPGQSTNGTPANSAHPGVTPSSTVHTHAHPVAVQAPAASSFPAKMPIPKQLPEKLTQPIQPVAVSGGAGPGRPTFNSGTGTAGGAISQPALPKVPAYVNEAESEHVLSKKKLDELVRQVCGGSAEGHEENLLAPEVEEVCYIQLQIVEGCIQDAPCPFPLPPREPFFFLSLSI